MQSLTAQLDAPTQTPPDLRLYTVPVCGTSRYDFVMIRRFLSSGWFGEQVISLADEHSWVGEVAIMRHPGQPRIQRFHL